MASEYLDSRADQLSGNSSIRSIASKKSGKGAKAAEGLPTSMSGLSLQNGANGNEENVVVFLVRPA
jgi:hypothetical protein